MGEKYMKIKVTKTTKTYSEVGETLSAVFEFGTWTLTDCEGLKDYYHLDTLKTFTNIEEVLK